MRRKTSTGIRPIDILIDILIETLRPMPTYIVSSDGEQGRAR